MKIDKPKTDSSIRSIKLDEDTIRVLQEQKKNLEEEALSDYWTKEGFVFPSNIGTALDPSNVLT